VHWASRAAGQSRRCHRATPSPMLPTGSAPVTAPCLPCARPLLSPGAGCHWLPTMEAGLQFCEEQFLEVAVRHQLCRPAPDRISMEEVSWPRRLNAY